MANLINPGNKGYLIATPLALWLFSSCSSEFVVSINEQVVYDPEGRFQVSEVSDADLQGCVNLAIQQQNARSAAELGTLSCANSEISNLENIDALASLRFLDLGNNNISNITPLENLSMLRGLNLVNNQVSDIGPLFNMSNLSSVNLLGNNDIACNELQALQEHLGSNLIEPEICEN